MRNEFKKKLVNLRPRDRLNQVSTYDGKNNTAQAEFVFNKPLHIKSEGGVALRSAYIPITYKNVIEGYNDRFYIIFNPTSSTAFNDCVCLTVQIPAGQYDTITTLSQAINTTLSALAVGVGAGEPGSGGGITNTFSTETDAVLTAGMTCTVEQTASVKNHLLFSIASNVKFASTNVTTVDGGDVANVNIDGGFQIAFKLAYDTQTNVAPAETRPANRLLGFSDEFLKLNGTEFPFFPLTRSTRIGHAVVNVNPPSVASVLHTPYIYVRCSLVNDAVETIPQGSKISNLLAKIPVSSSGYGDALFYQPDDGDLYFNISPQTIQNLTITLTDNEGRILSLLESEWEICLCVQGEFDI